MARRVREDRCCSNCGAQGVLAKGLCSPCYHWQASHDTPRPPHLNRRRALVPVRPCQECGRLEKPLARGLCRACYRRFLTTGTPRRPGRRTADPPPPPPPEDFFFHCLEQGLPKRWPWNEVVGAPGPRAGDAQRVLELLPERERYVLTMLYGLDGDGRRALGRVGAALGISGERVRQLHKVALARLGDLYRQPAPAQRAAPPPAAEAGALAELVRLLQEERALVSQPPGAEGGARTWEAGMVRGLRIGKQLAYDVTLGLVERLGQRLAMETGSGRPGRADGTDDGTDKERKDHGCGYADA